MPALASFRKFSLPQNTFEPLMRRGSVQDQDYRIPYMPPIALRFISLDRSFRRT